MKELRWACVLMVLLLASCSSREVLAPIEEIFWQPAPLKQKYYRVERGDTLYSIAFRFDQDYHLLARKNNMTPPFRLAVGRVLRVDGGYARSAYHAPSFSQRVQNFRRAIMPKKTLPKWYPSVYSKQAWIWPAKGTVKAYFNPAERLKGINIAGSRGAKIIAAQEGTVAYAGSGLNGYGNLIIIKHKNNFLSAYAYNSKNWVKEGQKVKAGQVIADMGVIDREYWGLHFEIRKTGLPVNPMYYLKRA